MAMSTGTVAGDIKAFLRNQIERLKNESIQLEGQIESLQRRNDGVLEKIHEYRIELERQSILPTGGTEK